MEELNRRTEIDWRDQIKVDLRQREKNGKEINKTGFMERPWLN